MTDAPIPLDIEAMPAVERLRYVLAHLRTGGRDLSDADIDAGYAVYLPAVDRI
jgi:hypothetical protein